MFADIFDRDGLWPLGFDGMATEFKLFADRVLGLLKLTG